jgi:hypothetical protein
MKIWVYIRQSQQGPYTVEQLSQLHLPPETPIWYEGLERWTPVGKTPLAPYLFDTSADADNVDEDAQHVDVAVDAAQQQEPVAVNPGLHQVAHAKTFIGWSIALTICCCGSPFSIAALVGSIITIMRNGAGDEERAQKASRVTEWLIIIAIALGVPMMFIYSLLSAI